MSVYTYLFKYIIIGDSSVGKSCILLQFVDRRFKDDHDTTIGVEFGSKIIKVIDQNMKLQIWDTAGQESFRSITRSYYRGSICALLVYDVTRRESFEDIAKWLEETKQYSNEFLTIALIGNKIDLSNKRKVTYDEGQQFAQKHNILFFECSAKTGKCVEDIFMKTAEIIFQKISSREIDPNNESIGIKIGQQAIKTSQFKKQDSCQC